MSLPLYIPAAVNKDALTRVAWTEPRTALDFPFPPNLSSHLAFVLRYNALQLCERMLCIGTLEELPERADIQVVGLDTSIIVQIKSGRLVFLHPPTTTDAVDRTPSPHLLPLHLVDALVTAAETRAGVVWTDEHETLYETLRPEECARLQFEDWVDQCAAAEWQRRGSVPGQLPAESSSCWWASQRRKTEWEATITRIAERRRLCFALYEVRQYTHRRNRFPNSTAQDPRRMRYLCVDRASHRDFPADVQLDETAFVNCTGIVSVSQTPPSADSIPFDCPVHKEQVESGALVFLYPPSSVEGSYSLRPVAFPPTPLFPLAISASFRHAFIKDGQIVWTTVHEKLFRKLDWAEWQRLINEAYIFLLSTFECNRLALGGVCVPFLQPWDALRTLREEFLVLLELYTALSLDKRVPQAVDLKIQTTNAQPKRFASVLRTVQQQIKQKAGAKACVENWRVACCRAIVVEYVHFP